MNKVEATPLYQGSFRWFLVVRCAAMVAYQMVGVAVGWQIYDLARRALDLELASLFVR